MLIVAHTTHAYRSNSDKFVLRITSLHLSVDEKEGSLFAPVVNGGPNYMQESTNYFA